MSKNFYFDCETTGLSPYKNSIIQIAFIVEVDGKIREEHSWLVMPWKEDKPNPRAMATHGITLETLRENGKDPIIMHRDLCSILSRYVDPYAKTDKFLVHGYNAKFDIDFLSCHFKRCEDRYFASYFSWKPVDPYPVLVFYDALKGIKFPDHKLGTMCRHFGISLDAHDALSDIKATKELIGKVGELFA